MEPPSPQDAALTVAIALAAGMVAQSAARHLRIPGIVLLLGIGVLLGPGVLGFLVPEETLGSGLNILVGFAVAVILFEGGMNLDLRRLRREARSIRQLVTVGPLITALGGALSARWILDWEWPVSVLFGTLVMVTGPTVITPMLRRIRAKRKVATVLEAEGVLVDALGAIAAVVALEVVITIAHREGELAREIGPAAVDLLKRLGFGAAAGALAGVIIAALLRVERAIPEGLENVFTLSIVLILFQAANALVPESGIVAVVAAGLVVGNVKTHALRDLREFKEQLTVMLIGMLFVLLAADVGIRDVVALGWPGVVTVLALMIIVRPLNIFIGTLGSDLTVREKAFLSWIAPRGIVAAAVASLFAQTLAREKISVEVDLRAMVFLVIAVTVLVQGLTGGLVAGLLGLRRRANSGYAILGANHLARVLGRTFRDAGEEVVFLESNHEICREAEAEGFRVIFGNGIAEETMQRAEMEGRAGAIALTPNDEVNLIFARRAKGEFKVPKVWVALRRGHETVTPKIVLNAGCAVLFGMPRNLDLWIMRLERRLATVVRCRREVQAPSEERERKGLQDDVVPLVLPVVVLRGNKILLVDGEPPVKEGDELIAALHEERRDEAADWLRNRGWAE